MKTNPKLYEELRELMYDDSTIYQHLKTQDMTGQDDLFTAIAIIKALVKEKKIYFNDAINTRNMSIIPIVIPKDSVLILSLWERIMLWFRKGKL